MSPVNQIIRRAVVTKEEVAFLLVLGLVYPVERGFFLVFQAPFRLCSALSPVLLFKQYSPQCRSLVNTGLQVSS